MPPFHVDAACHDNWHWPHPPIYQTPGCMVDMAAEVDRHVTIPVIAVGRLGFGKGLIVRRGRSGLLVMNTRSRIA